MDLKDFYIMHDMKLYEYMHIPVWAIPKIIMDNFNLWPLVHNSFVAVEICKGMYSLPQAGHIAYDGLIDFLEPYGYFPTPHTPGLSHSLLDTLVECNSFPYKLVEAKNSLKVINKLFCKLFLLYLRFPKL
jgi:hypothetical protein